MGFLVIGSTALEHHYGNEVRKPKDRDYLVSTDSSDMIKGVPGVQDVFSDYRLNSYLLGRGGYATPDELYTVKVSHAHWDLRNGSWSKHMADILFLQRKGCHLVPELYDTLYKIWIDVHGKKKMTFSESEEFFADAVTRKYDHDSLHESVAYGDHALYTEYLVAGRSVAMDMQKVWASPYHKIVCLFREEVYATALERLVIPNDYRYSPGRAYHWALRRTITSLTKGKSSLWLIENFRDFCKAQDPYTSENYVQRHKRKADKLIPLESK
jgi:hypothetical protein